MTYELNELLCLQEVYKKLVSQPRHIRYESTVSVSYSSNVVKILFIID